MVVAFIIAATCLLSKLIDYKAQKSETIKDIKDQIAILVRNEIRFQHNNLNNK